MMRTKYIFTMLVAALATASLVSCTDYPDNWGYQIRDTGDYRFTPSNLTETGYDAAMQSTILIENEGEGISEYGFNFFSDYSYGEPTYIPAEVQKNGEYVTLTATMPNLQFDRNYYFSAVTKNENTTFQTNPKGFNLSATELAPYLYVEPNMYLVGNTNLRVVQQISLREGSIKPEVTMELLGKTLKATVEGDSAVAVFDLTELDATRTDNLKVTAVNPYGTSTIFGNYNRFRASNLPSSVYVSAIKVTPNTGEVVVSVAAMYNQPMRLNPSVQVDFFGTVKDATYSSEWNSGYNEYYYYYTAAYNLYDLPMGEYNNRYVTVNVTNIFGTEAGYQTGLQLTLESCVTNSQDGDKGDYYQIDGVKWAKNDMTYNSTTQEYSVALHNTSSYYPFGMFGNTTKTGSTFWSSSTNPFAEIKTTGEYNVQMTSNDVVYANMSSWKLPTRKDFERLYNNTSIIFSSGNSIRFLPSKNNKRYILTGYVVVPDDTDALLFDSRGIQYWSRSYRYGTYTWSSSVTSTGNIMYMTSEFKNVYNGNSSVYVNSFSANTCAATEWAFNYNMHVRPIRVN